LNPELDVASVAALTFDFGNTLMVDPEPNATRRARLDDLASWLRECGFSVPEARIEAALESADAAQDRATDAATEFGAGAAIDHVLDRLGVRAGPVEEALLRRRFEDPQPERSLEPVDGVAEALGDLRRAGIHLGIVSNLGYRPARVMQRNLERANLSKFFEPDAVVFSDEVGMRKPNVNIFQIALDALGTSAARAAHVGDSKTYDVSPAREAGMKTIRFCGVRDDDSDGPEADLVVSSFEDLRRLDWGSKTGARGRRTRPARR
jgi:HAD superfamily hydrolase (TIGR01549 family)